MVNDHCYLLLKIPFPSSKKKLFMIYGKWTECLWGIDPVAYESFRKQERRGDSLRKTKPVRGCRGEVPSEGEGAWLGSAFMVQLEGMDYRICLSERGCSSA